MRSNLDFTTKRKKFFLKKSRNLDDLFYFEVRYLQIRWSDFDDFFCKLPTILFSFQLQKKKVSEIFKFSKKIQNCEFRPKSRKTANFWPNLKKMSIKFGISDPKFVKNIHQRAWHFIVRLCNFKIFGFSGQIVSSLGIFRRKHKNQGYPNLNPFWQMKELF